VRGPIDANARSDPWYRGIEKLTPEQYARHRVELVASGLEDASIRLNVPRGGENAWQASVLRAWLLNGSQALSGPELSVVLAALEHPFNEPVDPLASEADLMERRSVIDGLRFQLEMERLRRP
jgi:hypothetical protein